MIQAKPPTGPKVINGIGQDGAIPRGSLSIPMPAGAKPPPPASPAAKPSAGPFK
jgi:hypothetical protein